MSNSQVNSTENSEISQLVLGSIVVSIPACHAGDQGSIPCQGALIFCLFLSRSTPKTKKYLSEMKINIKNMHPARRTWTTDLRITAHSSTVLRSTSWAIAGWLLTWVAWSRFQGNSNRYEVQINLKFIWNEAYNFQIYTWSKDAVAEWLRRWTANPLGFPREGSNPFCVGCFF